MRDECFNAYRTFKQKKDETENYGFFGSFAKENTYHTPVYDSLSHLT